jgi:hypothetical protein
MSPRTRDLTLTLHVLTSIGWFGAVVVFLVLAIAGFASAQPRIVTASYLAMSLATRYVIVPLCFASLATGVIQSLATRWGLFRHYWVVIKLVLTVLATAVLLLHWVVIKLVLTLLATAVLLLHTRPIDEMAELVARTVLSPAEHRGMRIQLVFDAGAALVVLVVATVLAVYKPRGVTRYGRRAFSSLPTVR